MLVLFISSDSYHKKMLLESLNIPLKCHSHIFFKADNSPKIIFSMSE